MMNKSIKLSYGDMIVTDPENIVGIWKHVPGPFMGVQVTRPELLKVWKKLWSRGKGDQWFTKGDGDIAYLSSQSGRIWMMRAEGSIGVELKNSTNYFKLHDCADPRRVKRIPKAQ